MANSDGRGALGFKQCPQCAESGADNSKDNLVVYENGANCMACGFDQWKDLNSRGS